MYTKIHRKQSVGVSQQIAKQKNRRIMCWLSVQTLSPLLIRADATYAEEEEWSDEFDDDTDEATLGLIPFVIWITNHKDIKTRLSLLSRTAKNPVLPLNVIDFTSQRKLHLRKMWMRLHMQLRQRRTCMKTFTSKPTQWVHSYWDVFSLQRSIASSSLLFHYQDLIYSAL